MKFVNTLSPLLLAGTLLLVSACSIKPATTPEDATAKTTEAGKTPATTLKPVPQEANRIFQQALAQIQAGQQEEAIVSLQQLREKYPGFSGSLVNLGLIYLKQNDMKRAEKSFQDAIQITKNNPVAYTHLGILYRRQGKFTEAEKAYLEALKFNPGYTLAHLNIGILYDIYLHDAEKALQHYNAYQGLLAEKDKKVSKWIIDLERRLKTARKGTGGKS